MFISPALRKPPPRPQTSLQPLLIPMLLMLVIFYFLVIRPQAQRAKEQRENA